MRVVALVERVLAVERGAAGGGELLPVAVQAERRVARIKAGDAGERRIDALAVAHADDLEHLGQVVLVSRRVVAEAEGGDDRVPDAEGGDGLDGDRAVALLLENRHHHLIVGRRGRIVEIGLQRRGVPDRDGDAEEVHQLLERRLIRPARAAGPQTAQRNVDQRAVGVVALDLKVGGADVADRGGVEVDRDRDRVARGDQDWKRRLAGDGEARRVGAGDGEAVGRKSQ